MTNRTKILMTRLAFLLKIILLLYDIQIFNEDRKHYFTQAFLVVKLSIKYKYNMEISKESVCLTEQAQLVTFILLSPVQKHLPLTIGLL